MQLVSSGIFSGHGAAALFVSRALRERGHDVSLACVPGRSLEDKAREADVRLTALNGLRSGTLNLPVLSRALRNRSLDVVHAHRSPEHLACIMAGLSLRTRPVLVRTWHGHEVSLRRSLMLRLGRAHLVAVSVAARAGLERLAPGKTSLIRGGTDSRTFSPEADGTRWRKSLGIPPDAVVVGMSAKLSRSRRHDILLHAARELWEEFPRLWLLFIGDGATDEYVEGQARELGLAERTRCLVSVGGSFVELLACCDMGFIARAGSDGSCRAAMEFLSMARPVVACSSAVLPELVEGGRSGLVVGDGEVAGALRRLLADEEARARMGRAGREKVERELNMGRVARDYEKLYLSLLEARL